MKKIHKIIVTGLLSIVCTMGYTQQDAQYTQYMYNTISVNPAYAGSRGVMSIMGLHRSQWVGLEGAPRSQTLTLNTPIGNNERVGLGLSIVNDEIGPTDETYFDIDFSYTIPTSETGRLSFGLKAGAHLLNINLQELSQFNQNDALFETNIDNKFSPQVGIGVYYHTNRFYFGLSAPNLLETNHFDESTTVSGSDAVSFLAEERINYYFIAGHVFDISSDLKFKPAVLSKVVFGAPLQVDVSANFLMYERLTLGVAYRWSAAVTGQLGFQISDSMMIGLAYDRETTELGRSQFNDGSYEVMLRFELFKKYNRMLTPRFF
ncbi:type IX secretion system membrane protein PorP/SprF [Aquimarina sp. AD10]|uniref:PorP/SprF family type IX secretion system membrane protein n=1 Tax=Aquimarina sp. AD10 TaxID=1714849 RepID=UPI000E52EEFA|nr:type IX secretion system membrane protein PorP/SprF [Aquimarina sp. AD10]AXT59035.1 type IX secretion system membrane protein PorP/SprF [Aquimarina sp. AD10]RKM91381.1 type IX secretion system membrane protein PorP/SprF [Aquimarina sp. AD10]